MQPLIANMQELAMKIFICLGLVLAVSVAHAQPHGSTASHTSSHSAATMSSSHVVITKRITRFPDNDTYTTTRSGGYLPSASGGYHPMGN
jgi:hypothetical protein